MNPAADEVLQINSLSTTSSVEILCCIDDIAITANGFEVGGIGAASCVGAFSENGIDRAEDVGCFDAPFFDNARRNGGYD